MFSWKKFKLGMIVAVFFFLFTAASSAVSLLNFTTMTSKDVNDLIPPFVYLSMDLGGFYDATGYDLLAGPPPKEIIITNEMARKMSELPGVRSMDAPMFQVFSGKGMRPMLDDSPFADMYEDFFQRLRELRPKVPYDFNTRGIPTDYPLEYDSGLIGLYQGRFFKEGDLNVAVVSKTFAEANQLEVNSIMEFGSIHTGELHWLVEVVGIFEQRQDFQGGDPSYNINRQEQLNNQILLPLDFVEKAFWEIYETEEWEIEVRELAAEGYDMTVEAAFSRNPSFLLESLEDRDGFWEEAQLLIPPFWNINDYRINFAPIFQILDSMMLFSRWGYGLTLLFLCLLSLWIKRWYSIQKLRIGLSEIGMIFINVAVIGFFAGNHLITFFSQRYWEKQVSDVGMPLRSVCIYCHIDSIRLLDPLTPTPEQLTTFLHGGLSQGIMRDYGIFIAQALLLTLFLLSITKIIRKVKIEKVRIP